jgi:hypothetical protein
MSKNTRGKTSGASVPSGSDPETHVRFDSEFETFEQEVEEEVQDSLRPAREQGVSEPEEAVQPKGKSRALEQDPPPRSATVSFRPWRLPQGMPQFGSPAEKGTQASEVHQYFQLFEAMYLPAYSGLTEAQKLMLFMNGACSSSVTRMWLTL